MREAYAEPLSAEQSATLAAEDATHHMHVISVALVDGKPLADADGVFDFDALRARIAARLDRLPRQRQCLAARPLSGQPIWVDDPYFDLDYHVRQTTLPAPGDEVQLRGVVGRLASQKLDRGKPLWELLVVGGLDGGRIALISKTHVALLAAARLDVLGALFDAEPRPAPEPIQPYSPRRTPDRFARLTADLRSSPATWLRAWPGALGAGVRTFAAAIGNPSPALFRGSPSPHRRCEWVALELERIRAVARREQASVLDVALALVAGALRSYSEARGHESAPLRISVPVRVREELGPRSVAVWRIVLPLDEPDARVRLARISGATNARQRALPARPARELRDTAVLDAPTWLALAARPTSAPVSLTSVPGPRRPLYVLGAQLERCYLLPPLHPLQPLALSTFGLRDCICLAFSADPNRLENPQLLTDALVSSLNQLS
jgi:WS/DGAT/MGAT family acyltransferase